MPNIVLYTTYIISFNETRILKINFAEIVWIKNITKYTDACGNMENLE